MGELSIERDEVFRLRTKRTPGTLSRALAVIGDLGAHIGEIETVYIGAEYNVREVTVIAPDDAAVEEIHRALDGLEGVDVLPGRIDKVAAKHRGGKIAIRSTVEVRNLQDMREVYTPGVARVVQAIAADESVADEMTWRGKTVAIVTDGSRVLGLGDVGPAAALPVMEGKAIFYAALVGINAVPLVLDANSPEDIIETVVRVAPGFGGIHLEDIATPGVYEVERQLERRLSIPVLHDDQHGTAVVLVAAVVSAAAKLGLDVGDLVFGQVGLGAAGSAIAGLASGFGFKEIVAFDPSEEGVARLREVADPDAPVSAATDNFDAVVESSDVLVLTTGRPGLLSPDRVRPGQIVFALTNPIPEIQPEDARAAGARLAADGSIVNNVLAYPGLFRGALDARAAHITSTMKRAAALAIAEMAPEDQLLPDALDVAVHEHVAAQVAAATRAGD